MKGSTILSESILTGFSIVISFILIVLVVRVVISQQTDRTYKNLFESVARDIVVIIDKLSSTTGSGLIEYKIPKGVHINLKIDYKSVFVLAGNETIKKSFSGNLNSGPYDFYEPEVLCFVKSKYDNEIVIVDEECSCDIKPGVCDIISVVTTTTSTTIVEPDNICRVHFSGMLISGIYIYRISSMAFVIDGASEILEEGEYSDNQVAFPKAIAATFDGIAIDENTHLIIYSDKNFQGDVVLDITGPAIVNNVRGQGIYPVNDNQYWPDSELSQKFPSNVRFWSDGYTENWKEGSCKIICEGTT